MRVAIDTNQYRHAAAGEPSVRNQLQAADHIFLPFVVLAELRAGFLLGSKAEENERSLIRFLNSSRTSALFSDEQTTHHYARLYRQLRRQGTPIPSNDLWIAALVIQHDLVLCSADKHFDHLPQLPRV